jgi:hypothetical protein
MNRDLTLEKIKADISLLIFVSLIIIFAHFSFTKEKQYLNWGIGIFSFLVLAIVIRRMKLSGFQTNPNLGITDCASLDDYENWLRLIIMLLFIPLVPLDLIIQSTFYFAKRTQ